MDFLRRKRSTRAQVRITENAEMTNEYENALLAWLFLSIFRFMHLRPLPTKQ